MRTKPTTTPIFCCACDQYTLARLTDGSETYPHRSDLKSLPFWVCDTCGNFVGCHHKTKQRTKPLGCIATQAIKEARKRIHWIMDPLWKSGKLSRKEVYAKIAEKLGYEYHTADIRSVEEANRVYNIVRELR